jgi:ectoine hydrolase
VIEENMTFHFMPAIWTDDWGFETSETIRIRAGAAAECLADVPRELTVKP